MFMYLDFVERMSSKTTRPFLVSYIIHGLSSVIIIFLIATLYLVGWLYQTLLLLLILMSIAWFGKTLLYRIRNEKDKPPIVHTEPMNKPKPYDERYHVKHFLKRVAMTASVGLLTIFLMIAMIFTGLLELLDISTSVKIVIQLLLLLIGSIVLLACSYGFYQKWWKWNNWRIVGDPVTGQIGFTQPDSPRWLLVRGSSTDYFNLDEYTLYTPEKSLAEFLIFKRSQMVGLLQGNVANASLTRRDFKKISGPPHHEDIKDVDRLIAIQRYWRALARQEEAHSRSTVELLEVSVAQGELLFEQHNKIIELLSIIAGKDAKNYLIDYVLAEKRSEGNNSQTGLGDSFDSGTETS